MKLAIVTTHPVQYNAPWFKILAQSAGLEVMVFYTWGQSERSDKFDPGFGKIIEWDIPLLEGYDYRFVKNTASDPGSHHFKGIVTPHLINEIEQWGAERILVFGWSFYGHLKCLRYFHGKIPVLFRGDSTLLDELPGLKKNLRRLALKWIYRSVDMALYVGTNNKEYFKVHGVPEQKLAFSPHAIDNKRFADPLGNLAIKAKTWRKELGFLPEDVVVLFAGKLEPKKNPCLIVELAARMATGPTRFLMVGNGELEQELKKRTSLMPNVRFLDFQNQSVMPVVYRMADIFILPSKGPGETWGLALNEAMACGLPVVASNKVGGAIDLIISGQNGHIFQSEDLGDLENKLNDMVFNGNLVAMGAKSKEIIQSWSFDQIVKSIHEVL